MVALRQNAPRLRTKFLALKDAGSAYTPPAIDLANRTARFRIWDSAPDRERDVLPASLLDWSEYYPANPVLMFNHSWQPGSPETKPFPVGECVGIEYDSAEDAVFAVFKFYEAREVKPGLWVNTVAEEVWQAVSTYQIRTCSIGFIENPGAVSLPGGGAFLKTGAKLIEVSIVPVPAKATAALAKALKRIEAAMSKTTKAASGTTSEGGAVPTASGTTSDNEPAQDHESMLAQHGAHVAAMGGLLAQHKDLHEQMKATHSGMQQTHADTMKALGQIKAYAEALGASSEGDDPENAVDGDTSDVGEGDDGKDPMKKSMRAAILKMAEAGGLKVAFGTKGAKGAGKLAGGHLALTKTIHKAATSMLNKHMAAGGTVDPDDDGDNDAAPAEGDATKGAPKPQPQAIGTPVAPGDPSGDNAFPKALAKGLGEARTVEAFGALLKAFPQHDGTIKARAKEVATIQANAQAKVLRREFEREVLGRTNPVEPQK